VLRWNQLVSIGLFNASAISRKGALMTDQQEALQAMSDAHRILEEFLEPRPHNDQRILERLVEVLERPDVVVAVDRLQRANGGN
jgi:hypothetical protein